jgi:WD40 repeat protein
LDQVPGSRLFLVPNRRTAANSKILGFVEVWNETLSQMQKELDASQDDRQGTITVARSSPCGKFVAAGERYQAGAMVLDRATGRILLRTPAARARLNDLAYSPDGKSLAITFQNGCLEYYHFDFDEVGIPSIMDRPLILDAHRGEATCVRFIAPDMVATCGSDGLIRIWSVSPDGTRTLDVTSEKLSGMQLSPDGSRLVCTSQKEIVIVDLESGDAVFRLNRPEDKFKNPVWSLDSKRIAIGCSASKTVLVLDRNGQTISSIPHGANPEAVAFSPDRSFVAITSLDKLQLCDVDNGRVRISLPVEDEGLSLAFSHDGTRLACGGQFQGISVIDLTTMKVHQKLACSSSVYCFRST